MTKIQLTETQAVILTAACARENADIFPLTTGIKGGAVTKVIGSLMKKGLVERFIGGYPAERDPEHGMVSFRATRLAFETLGISEDDIPASLGPEQAGETEPDETGIPEETATQGDTGAEDAPVGAAPEDGATPAEEVDTGADSEPVAAGPTDTADELPQRDFLAAAWELARQHILQCLSTEVRHAGGTEADIETVENAMDEAVQAAIRRRNSPGKPSTRSRKTSKTDILVDMLQGTGATIDELVEATGWQAHSARAAISHILKKKMGLTVISEKVDGRGRVYRVAE